MKVAGGLTITETLNNFGSLLLAQTVSLELGLRIVLHLTWIRRLRY